MNLLHSQPLSSFPNPCFCCHSNPLIMTIGPSSFWGESTGGKGWERLRERDHFYCCLPYLIKFLHITGTMTHHSSALTLTHTFWLHLSRWSFFSMSSLYCHNDGNEVHDNRVQMYFRRSHLLLSTWCLQPYNSCVRGLKIAFLMHFICGYSIRVNTLQCMLWNCLFGPNRIFFRSLLLNLFWEPVHEENLLISYECFSCLFVHTPAGICRSMDTSSGSLISAVHLMCIPSCGSFSSSTGQPCKDLFLKDFFGLKTYNT